MKTKLNNKAMETISGGGLERGKDNSYIVSGEPNLGGFMFMINFGTDFISALEFDWDWFADQYSEQGIFTIDELEKHYNYGQF